MAGNTDSSKNAEEMIAHRELVSSAQGKTLHFILQQHDMELTLTTVDSPGVSLALIFASLALGLCWARLFVKVSTLTDISY